MPERLVLWLSAMAGALALYLTIIGIPTSVVAKDSTFRTWTPVLAVLLGSAAVFGIVWDIRRQWRRHELRFRSPVYRKRSTEPSTDMDRGKTGTRQAPLQARYSQSPPPPSLKGRGGYRNCPTPSRDFQSGEPSRPPSEHTFSQHGAIPTALP